MDPSRWKPAPMASRKKLRPNAQRRASVRRLEKLAKDRARLAALEAGGARSTDRGIVGITHRAKARSLRCVRCEDPYQSRITPPKRGSPSTGDSSP